MTYQELQKQQIDYLESVAHSSEFPASVVTPVEDYSNDQRRYLTITAHPSPEIVNNIVSTFIAELKNANPDQYYCDPSSLHFTILSIRLFLDGNNFESIQLTDIAKVASTVFANHPAFNFNMYRIDVNFYTIKFHNWLSQFW